MERSGTQAAATIAADDLDVLVDLSTHTMGAKPGILAAKPARVQITHVASSGTVGLSTIDFKLTDHFADLPENRDADRAAAADGRVPLSVPSHRGGDRAPYHRTALGIAEDTIVIGAFASALKLTRRCIALWREVLERIPRAKLAFSPFYPALRLLYLRLLAAGGIPPDALIFIPPGRNEAERSARYAIVDFVIDTMPYGGVNGALEPLDVGVPVVTLRAGGTASAPRIRSSPISASPRPLRASGREYVDIAARLASEPDFMRDVRERIRGGIAHSPLTDRVAHTRALERAYIDALERRAPEAFETLGTPSHG